MRILLFLIAVICSGAVTGQRNSLSNTVKFKDGVYFSSLDFANNSPSLSLSEVQYLRLKGGIPNQRYLYNFKLATPNLVSLDTISIWGICIDGVPYINQSHIFEEHDGHAVVDRKEIYGTRLEFQTHAFTFTRIMLIGHLCHFTAEALNTGYEPINDPFPDKNDFIPNKGDYGNITTQQYLIKVTTGEIYKFNHTNLHTLIKDDEELYDSYSELKNSKRKKEIFNFFREYNKRNPIDLI